MAEWPTCHAPWMDVRESDASGKDIMNQSATRDNQDMHSDNTPANQETHLDNAPANQETHSDNASANQETNSENTPAKQGMRADNRRAKWPHNKNDDVELHVDAMNHEGMGVARLDGMAVFVQGALPGERVTARLIKVASSYAVARVQTFEEASPERREPFCPVFKRCGGCSLQHMSYPETLRFKRQVVQDSLARIGGLADVAVTPVLGMDHPFKYRNKARYPVGHTGKRPIAGFYARRSHELVDASACGITHPSTEKVRAAVLAWAEAHQVPVYDETSGKGVLRHIVCRVGTQTGEVLAMVVSAKDRIPHADKLVSRLRAEVPGLVGVVLNVNEKAGNVVLGQRNFILHGSPVLLEKLGGMTFEITPLSFFQVNTEQTEALYRKALEAAALTGTETVFDLYCGIGTISLLAARKAKQVIGVEVVEEAVESAEENARRNRVENVAFHAGTAETVVPALYAEGVKADVVIVDPPRKGCDATLLQTILEMQPDRIVYVSCNPSTLARDLKVLCGERTNAAGNGTAGAAGGEPVGEAGHDSMGETADGKPVYRIQSVQPVDMFPWTEHVETVVLMSRKDK